jgi:Flp pilus assembly protein protease CpaA
MLKPVPVTDAALIVTAVVPVEVNVMVCVADVFRFTVPKAMVVAFTLKVAVLKLVTLQPAAATKSNATRGNFMGDLRERAREIGRYLTSI